MPRSPRNSVRELLRALPDAPSVVQFDAAIAALVADAALTAHPLMSLAATLRHRAGHLEPQVRDRIRDAAQAALLKHRATTPAPESAALPTGEWLTVREAALALGITEATQHERLRHRHHRQRLGWPMWDGHRFWIATAAVDPKRRAAFLAAQPSSEPLPQLLPSSCLPLAEEAAGPQPEATACPSTAPSGEADEQAKAAG